jgi:hypothetical protein
MAGRGWVGGWGAASTSPELVLQLQLPCSGILRSLALGLFLQAAGKRGGRQSRTDTWANSFPLQSRRQRCHQQSQVRKWWARQRSASTRQPGVVLSSNCPLQDSSTGTVQPAQQLGSPGSPGEPLLLPYQKSQVRSICRGERRANKRCSSRMAQQWAPSTALPHAPSQHAQQQTSPPHPSPERIRQPHQHSKQLPPSCSRCRRCRPRCRPCCTAAALAPAGQWRVAGP